MAGAASGVAMLGGKGGSARSTANKPRWYVVTSNVVDPGSTNEPKQKESSMLFWGQMNTMEVVLAVKDSTPR